MEDGESHKQGATQRLELWEIEVGRGRRCSSGALLVWGGDEQYDISKHITFSTWENGPTENNKHHLPRHVAILVNCHSMLRIVSRSSSIVGILTSVKHTGIWPWRWTSRWRAITKSNQWNKWDQLSVACSQHHPFLIFQKWSVTFISFVCCVVDKTMWMKP